MSGIIKLTKDLYERYDCTCAACGAEFQFRPSISMSLGMNRGHGTCHKCKAFLHLEITDEENAKGRSQLWDDYLKKETVCPQNS